MSRMLIGIILSGKYRKGNMDDVKRYLKIILNIIIPLAGIFLVIYVGPKLLRFFMPFVIGWVIAMIANPLVRFLEKKLKIVRKHSSVLIVVVVLAAVIGVLYLVFSKLVIQAVGFAKDLPLLYETVMIEIKEVMIRYEHIFDLMPLGLQTSLDQFTNNIGQYLSIIMQKAASPTVEVAGNVAKSIPSAMVSSIITILSSYLFIAERERIVETIKKYMPDGGFKYIGYLKKEIRHLIGGYFLAQFRIMFVVALILAAGFLILGVKYALLLAVLIAILDFLPVFGTGTALFPWALFQLVSGNYAFAIALVLIYVLTQVIRQVIQPKIVGDTMGIPPLLTLLFLYLGFKVQGLAGMILAVPLGLLVLNLYHYGTFDSLIENMRILIHDVNEFRKTK